MPRKSWSHAKGKNSGRTLVETFAKLLRSVSALFALDLDINGLLSHVQTVSLEGNPLDLTAYPLEHDSRAKFVVSLDNLHKPGSTSIIRENQETADKLVQIFAYDGEADQWYEDTISTEQMKAMKTLGQDEMTETDSKKLSRLLYNIEELRKREFDN